MIMCLLEQMLANTVTVVFLASSAAPQRPKHHFNAYFKLFGFFLALCAGVCAISIAHI